MALIVGNLLDDPLANTFIGLADADAFLRAEGNASWALAERDSQEAALVSASRWLAVSLSWCATDMSDADLARVGHVAARLAVQALTVDLWAADGLTAGAKRYKADTVEVEYFEGSKRSAAQAGGKRFPWVMTMLRGLLCRSSGQHDVSRR